MLGIGSMPAGFRGGPSDRQRLRPHDLAQRSQLPTHLRVQRLQARADPRAVHPLRRLGAMFDTQRNLFRKCTLNDAEKAGVILLRTLLASGSTFRPE